MKCPHCNSEVDLTWKRYWASPMGNHGCTQCGESFRLKHSVKYYAAIVFMAIALGSFFPLFAKYWGAAYYLSVAAYLLCCLVILIPIDRWIDSKWRGTVPVKKK